MSGPSTLERPPEVVIDPRIRARRIEVRRHEGRRRLGRLVEAALVVAVALCFVGALFTPLLDVDRITVSGGDPGRAEQVVAAAGVDLGTPLVSIDLRAVGERVVALPWVAEVEVHRTVGGSIDLAVTERRPVATVAGPDGPMAVDAEGRVLGPADGAAELPQLEGVDPVAPGEFLPASTLDALAVAAELGASLPGTVTALDPAELVGTLALGGRVRFGGPERLEAKLRSLTTVLAQVDLTCLDTIDLRLPGSPVLTREEGCP